MENKSLKTFAIVFGLSVFLVITLAVMRLTRLSFIAFGLSGIVFLIWGIFLANNDEELKEKEKNTKEPLPKAKTPLQRKLLKQIDTAKQEILLKQKGIEDLYIKSAYFIKKLYKSFVPKGEEPKETFLAYEKLKEQHREEVVKNLSDKCNEIVQKNRSQIELLNSEIHYWQTLEDKYTDAFIKISNSQDEIDRLNKELKQQERKSAKDTALRKEMEEYLDTPSSTERKLEESLYQNSSFEDVRGEVNNQLSELETTINSIADEIGYLEEVSEQYFSLKNTVENTKFPIEEGLTEEIRLLSKQLEDL